VLEAMDSEHKEFGHERTAAALTARDSLDPAMVIDDVRKAIKEFTGNAPQSDDITMLALRLG
jgi:serine phosphatase RsbU (regulator of sigma subunit)